MSTTLSAEDKRAPMAAAPMKYREDGEVDWGNMWDTFCVLAQDGGPPHRDTMLYAPEGADMTSAAYRGVVAELARGIHEVSGLIATATAEPGWLAVQCPSEGMVRWLADAILQENVQARAEGTRLLVPVGEHFTPKGEIKNVITAVAKTTHYWGEHLPPAVKQTLAWQVRFDRLVGKLKGLGRRGEGSDGARKRL